MATWHQQKAAVPLWHSELYTVVTDPPNGCMSVARYKDPVQAVRESERTPHSYVIPPTGGFSTPNPGSDL